MNIESQQRSEAIDILGNHHWFHWTDVKKIPKILQKGLYSPVFAGRIKDEEYSRNSAWGNWVWFNANINELWPSTLKPSSQVALIVDNLPEGSLEFLNFASVLRRVSPRRFVGLVIDDLRLTEEEQSRLLDDVLASFNKTGVNLPIYGASGNLLMSERRAL